LAREPLPVFRSSAADGFSPAVAADPARVWARKLEQRVEVRFAPAACVIETAEGRVHAGPADAIVTGLAGELWRVSRGRFAQKYRPLPPTVEGEPGTYVSLPNRVLALRLERPSMVVLADEVSELTGRAGDWLVDYGDGSLGIVATEIFARTYEILP
jgi:hypothetical protein